MVRAGQFWAAVLIFSLVVMQIRAISNLEANVQNAITEEERRGADHVSTNQNHHHSEKQNAKIVEDNDKKTRGIMSLHSPSATHKHQHYFVPSAYDSHLVDTGHGGGSFAGSTSGYDYVTHGAGPTGPTTAGGPTGGHVHHHNGATGYASATGFGGYGLAHGYGHGGAHGGYGGLTLGGGGYGGAHGHFAYGHGHELFGGHGGGLNNALALKGLLIPLAGIALLGAAAALSTNPVLLQLGVVNGRRRRRRSIRTQHYPANPHVQPNSNY